jgi:hypothetical protein
VPRHTLGRVRSGFFKVGFDASQDGSDLWLLTWATSDTLLDDFTESEQLAAPLEGGWVRSGFFKAFDASQDFKMKVIAAVQVFSKRLIC